MSDTRINIAEISFDSEEIMDSFMELVETDEAVFGFECIGEDISLEAVTFKPSDRGIIFLFLTEGEDVKGEFMKLSYSFPGISINYLMIAPGESEVIISCIIEAGEVMGEQAMTGPAAYLIGEMTSGGFSG